VTWQGPGFVDHHTHLLRVSVGAEAPCDATDPAEVAAYHRAVLGRWSTPMDEPTEPLVVHDGVRGALERGLARAAGLGLVQVTEAGMHDWSLLEALQDLRARGPLPVRVRVLAASGIAEPSRMRRTGDPWVELEGVKFYADGWLGPRTCALTEPFADEDHTGLLFLDADTLARRADPFAEAGFTIATHAIGDRAIEAVLDGYELLYGSDCAAAAPRIEHAQVLRPDLVRRMADLGVVVCIQPSFAVSDAATARVALGSARMEHAYRWDLLLAEGVRVISGADFPIEPLSPLEGLERLVTGAEAGKAEQLAAPLSLEQALAIMTDPAAGTVVLSDDPATAGDDHLAELEVVETLPVG
jgi:predicted amidohydrolase YtcJ